MTTAAFLIALVYGIVLTAIRVRMLLYVRRYPAGELTAYAPKAAVIVPCKDVSDGFEHRMINILNQQYPDYEVVFVVGSQADAAWPLLNQIVQGNPRSKLVTSGRPTGRSQKVHNLLRGLEESEAEVLVFADSDGEFSQDWLYRLVSPLNLPGVSAATGCFWLEPRCRTIWSTSLAWAYNTEITPIFAINQGRMNIAWGGSIAVKRSLFYQAQMDKVWEGAAYDDLPLAESLSQYGRIHFVPAALITTPIFNGELPTVINWYHRQFVASRIYTPFLFGVSAVLLIPLILMVLSPLLLMSGFILPEPSLIWAGLGLFAIYPLRMITGSLYCLALGRGHTARYALLDYASVLVAITAYGRAIFSRRITWAGMTYDIVSRSQTEVLP